MSLPMKFKMALAEFRGVVYIGNGYLPSVENYTCSFANSKSFVIQSNLLGEMDPRGIIGFCFMSDHLVDTVAGCAFSSWATKYKEQTRQDEVVRKKNAAQSTRIRDEGLQTLLDEDDSRCS